LLEVGAVNSLKEKVKQFPSSPGVYLFRGDDGSILYVGKAIDLKKRVSSYFNRTAKDPRIELMISQAVDVDFVVLKSEAEALVLEDKFVKEYQPKYNVDLKDDKRYPFLRITLNEAWPRIQLVRKREDDGARYFGPYTDVGALRSVLKFLRKTFKVVSCKHKIVNPKEQRHCLYYHLGECLGPEMASRSPLEYQDSIKQVCLLLEGKGDELLKTLRAKMLFMSRNKSYEKAAKIRDVILDLESVVGSKIRKDVLRGAVYRPAEISREVEDLKSVLSLSSVPMLIDAFDVSNLFGEDAVGSLVVFRNGVPFKSGYRRFKINTVTGISDYAMIREVMVRRYKRLVEEKGKLPDLIVVDGGLGQYSIAREVLLGLGLGDVKIIGLAKKFEEIFSPEVLRLPKSCSALKLLMRIRDEAHRFAVTYHRRLKRKSLQARA
jgi:excinuclease ABC subunit C